MSSLHKSVIQRLLITVHFILMIGVFLACWVFFYRLPAIQGEYFMHNSTILVAYTLLLFTMSRIYGCYKVGMTRVGDLISGQVIGNLISWGIVYVIACVMAQKLLNPLMGFGAAAVQTGITVVWLVLLNRVYFRLNPPKKTVAVFRNDADLSKLREFCFFANKWDVRKRVQCIDACGVCDVPGRFESSHTSQKADKIVGGNIHDIIREIADYDAVFVAGVNATLRNGIAKYCVEMGKECFFVPHTGDVIISGGDHIRSFSIPVMRIDRAKPDPEFLLIKRVFDIVISLIVLIVMSPFMLLTAIAIKAYDGGPVLYRQTRLTKDGKRFRILKFRSMVMDAEKDGVARLSSGEKDDRITPVGRFIRTIRFDELPQLFNVLVGQMSIVGPRPERPEIAKQYAETIPAFHLRLQVKAGLTGYAQVYGKYNTEPADKLKMDLMYIHNIGIAEDIRLILATVRVLFQKGSTEGIAPDQETAIRQREEELV